MLRGTANTALALSGALWYPGKKTTDVSAAAPPSQRAMAIAKAREEMLGLLQDVPESDYELSLTDLVDKKLDDGDESSASREQEPDSTPKVRERSKNKMNRRSISFSSGNGGGGGGVLLNMYMPTFARSLTPSRACRRTPDKAHMDYNKRDQEGSRIRSSCWSAIWDMMRGKSRRLKLESP